LDQVDKNQADSSLIAEYNVRKISPQSSLKQLKIQ